MTSTETTDAIPCLGSRLNKTGGITIARKTAELCLDQLCIIFLLVSARSLAHQTHLSFTSWLSGLELSTVHSLREYKKCLTVLQNAKLKKKLAIAQYRSGLVKGGVGTAKGRVLDQLSYCTFSKAHNNFMY